MSNVIPFDPNARKSPVAKPATDDGEEISLRRRAYLGAGLRMGWEPDFMTSKDKAQPYIDALMEAAKEVTDEEVRFKLMALGTALIARSTAPPTKRKKPRKA